MHLPYFRRTLYKEDTCTIKETRITFTDASNLLYSLAFYAIISVAPMAVIFVSFIIFAGWQATVAFEVLRYLFLMWFVVGTPLVLHNGFHVQPRKIDLYMQGQKYNLCTYDVGATGTLVRNFNGYIVNVRALTFQEVEEFLALHLNPLHSIVVNRQLQDNCARKEVNIYEKVYA